jgi:hypothetical protein
MKIALIILVAVIPTVCAAETRVLTLDQAVSIAMEKNRILKRRASMHSMFRGNMLKSGLQHCRNCL